MWNLLKSFVTLWTFFVMYVILADINIYVSSELQSFEPQAACLHLRRYLELTVLPGSGLFNSSEAEERWGRLR